MKRIFALTVFLSVFSAHAETGDMTVVIYSPLNVNAIESITAASGLGAVNSGNFIIRSSNSPSGQTGVEKPHFVDIAAVFMMYGHQESILGITMPSSTSIENQYGNSIDVTQIESIPAEIGLFNPKGMFDLQVEAKMSVKNTKLVGAYTGSMTITVDYN